MKTRINRLFFLCYKLLFLVTPLLMYHKTSELFEFNKMLFIYAIAGSVLSLWLYEWIGTGKFVFKRTVFDKFLLLFVGVQTLATVFSIDKHTSFYGYYGRFDGGLLSIFAFVVLFYGLVSHIDQFQEYVDDAVHTLVHYSLASSFLVIVWGISGKLGYDLTCLLFTGNLNNACWTDQFNPAVRMFSTLGQPNWLGAYLSVTFFMSLYYLVARQRMWYGALSILSFIAILFTRSRSALLAVLLGLAGYSTLYFWAKKDKKSRQLAGLFLGALFVSCVVFKTGVASIDRFFPSFEQTKKVEQQAPSGVTESFDIRKIVWEGAVKLGLKHPALGTGPETFAYSYYFTRPAAHNNTSEWDFIYNRAHNEFLNILATSGFIGLGSYLLLVGAVYGYFMVYLIRRKKHDDHFYFVSTMLIAYSTIHVTNFFGFATTTISIYFYLIPALLFAFTWLKQERVLPEYIPQNKKKAQYVGVLTCIFGAIFVVSYLLADINYAQGDNLAKIQEYEKSRVYLERALTLRSEPLYQDKLSGVYANLAFLASFDQGEENKKNEKIKNLIALSEKMSDKALAVSPYNPVFWKTRAKNLYLFYQITLDPAYFVLSDKAVDAAQALAPTDPKILYSRAVYYLAKFDNEELQDKAQAKQSLADRGLTSINRAIEMKTDYRDAYYVRGLILKKLGRKDEAVAVFQYMLNTFDKNDEEVQRELKSF